MSAIVIFESSTISKNLIEKSKISANSPRISYFNFQLFCWKFFQIFLSTEQVVIIPGVPLIIIFCFVIAYFFFYKLHFGHIWGLFVTFFILAPSFNFVLPYSHHQSFSLLCKIPENTALIQVHLWTYINLIHLFSLE